MGAVGIIPMVPGLGGAFCSFLPTLPAWESLISSFQPLWMLLHAALEEFLNRDEFLNLA